MPGAAVVPRAVCRRRPPALDPPLGGGRKLFPVSPRHLRIGPFSRASSLSIKALRAYHEQGLLVPAEVEPSNEDAWLTGIHWPVEGHGLAD